MQSSFIDHIMATKKNPEFTGSISMGRKASTTVGVGSVAVGQAVEASGLYANGEGFMTTAKGAESHAEGYDTTTTTSAIAAHSEGRFTTANGQYSHAEGFGDKSGTMDAYNSAYIGTGSHGEQSHAEGDRTWGIGNSSHAEGTGTVATNRSQHVFGEYNKKDDNVNSAAPTERGKFIEIVGNGSAFNRSNARTLDWNGNEVLAGKLTLGSAPTDNMDAVTKQYVDTSVGSFTEIDDTAGDGTTNKTWSANKIYDQFALKAPLASPALTGTPTAPTAANGTNTTQIATTAYVMNAFAANDAMSFKGTIGSSGATVTTLPANHTHGWTYRVATAGTYAGKVCEIGDMIICVTDGTSANNDHWAVVQSNIDGAVTGPSSATDAHVAIFDGETGKIIKDSGLTMAVSVPAGAKFTDTNTKVTSSANHYTPATASGSDVTASATGATAAWSIDVVKGITLNTDGKGHVTGMSVTSGKIPAQPTIPTAASAAPGNVAATSAKGSSTAYARQDHTHGIDLATGDSNGQVKIAGTNVSVKGLGSNAYTSTEYAPKASPVFTGSVSMGRVANSTVGTSSVALGDSVTASDSYSFAEGSGTSASGSAAHAEGMQTTASGGSSHAEGFFSEAEGDSSHAEGDSTHAVNIGDHAEGSNTTASGNASHAEGTGTTASGTSAHSEGEYTTAEGAHSHAEGYYTTASRRAHHVFGEYNVLDTSGSGVTQKGTYIELVGNGTSSSARSNARTLDWSGNEVLSGSITVGSAAGGTMKYNSTTECIEFVFS